VIEYPEFHLKRHKSNLLLAGLFRKKIEITNTNAKKRGMILKKTILLASLISLMLGAFAYAETLEDYVGTGMEDYRWNLTSHTKLDNGVDAYFLDLSSGRWQNIVWNHRLRVLVPPGKPTGAIVFVTGSGSGTAELQWLSEAAVVTRQVVVILHDVPNQPLFGGMKEDELLAFTWTQFLKTKDTTWLCHLPMTRAVVRAMDAVDEFALGQLGRKPKGYMVCGGSKRGWTTWLTAAVDQRILGITPAVYDNLNLPAQLEHQIAAWGDYSFKISDYTSLNLHEIVDTPEGQILVSIVDPYAYREKISVPKLIVNGTNDPYWPVDAIHCYVDDLVGDTYFLYVPNAGHDLGGDPRVIIPTLAAFTQSVLVGDLQLPKLAWEIQEVGNQIQFQVHSDQRVKEGKFWLSISSNRDFRNTNWMSVNALTTRSLCIWTFLTVLSQTAHIKL
jgi:PhoPQ-activated pathogenicity-related protein